MNNKQLSFNNIKQYIAMNKSVLVVKILENFCSGIYNRLFDDNNLSTGQIRCLSRSKAVLAFHNRLI